MHRRWQALILPWLVLFPLWWAGHAVRAVAAGPYGVNVGTDADDAAIGDGVCETVPNTGICSLRAAVQEANFNPGPDTINLPSGTYLLAQPGQDDNALNGDLDITGTLTIIGAGANSTFIDGNGSVTADRVFQILTGTVMNISGVTIRHGKTTGFGGGILNLSQANLTLANTTVTTNTASGASARGGGIYNAGRLFLSNSTVSSNSVTTSDNFGGGGILDNGPMLIMTGTSVSGNNTNGFGGGLMTFNVSLTATQGTFNGNHATKNGGGIYRGGAGTLLLINSTVSGNGTNNSGGGIYSDNGTVNLFNVTVTGNFADADTFGGGVGGGITFFGSVGGPDGIYFKNSIIAGNLDLAPGPSFSDGDCSGTVTSQGPNLMQGYNGLACTVVGAAVPLAVPLLGPLADNGGATRTHALLAGSPALDAGEMGNCTNALGAPITNDQRGYRRPEFGGVSVQCDLGAFEVVGPVFLPLLRR